jgi:hypothetical protein
MDHGRDNLPALEFGKSRHFGYIRARDSRGRSRRVLFRVSTSGDLKISTTALTSLPRCMLAVVPSQVLRGESGRRHSEKLTVLGV